jgi:glycosyltransferase involved in cell wall biosynthesis
LNQTYQNWEWIILDDGSTDNSGDIIKGVKDSRIYYTFQEHAGIEQLVRTYNKALQMCNGDFIAMLDHDDYWPEYKLEIQIESFDNYDIVLSYGECCMVNQKGKKISYESLPDDPSIALNDPVGSSLKVLMFKRYSFIPNVTVMLKRIALMNIGGFVEAKGLYQDFPTWTRLSLEGRFAAIPRCLGYWRRHPSAITLNSNPEVKIDLRLKFLRDFVLQNKKRLNELGFFYDMDRFEEHWEEIRKEHIPYLPYNRAMLMLSLGLFDKAKAEFKKFLGKDSSLKNKLIYYLIVFSGLIKADIVNPVADFKRKIGIFFKK